MKTILLLFLILTFTSLSFIFSFAKADLAFAQEEGLSIKEATVSGDAKTAKSVEYELPYPGILPDNPLYFLKAIRDRLITLVIADPLKMADFSLLQADKRLNAGVYLIKKDKDKYQLAESTVSKGENYFEKAIEKTKEAKRQGKDIKDMSRRLFNASKKHQEVILDLTKNADSRTKGSLNALLKRVVDFEKQAKTLMSK